MYSVLFLYSNFHNFKLYILSLFPHSFFAVFCCLTLTSMKIGTRLFCSTDNYHSDVHLLFVVIVSCVQLFVTPWTAALQAPLSFTISWSLFKFMSIKSVMPSNHLILYLLLLLLSSTFTSTRVLYNESILCIRWPKC